MIRILAALQFMITIYSCGSGGKVTETNIRSVNEPVATATSEGDLSVIRWIEGKWRGSHKGNPFYEIYEIKDDRLLITSYEWNGKDSSKSSVDHLAWKNDGYYLGKQQNYRVTVLSDSVIKMIPVKANNEIIWRKTRSGWDAILAGKQSTNIYNMEHFDPFKK